MPDLSNTQRSPDPVVVRGASCLTDEEICELSSGRLHEQRASAVNAHLDRCPTCQKLVSAARSSDPLDGHSATSSTTFQPGDVVGRRYRIHRFVARGGMGEVYEANDLELNERIALKTVLPNTTDAQRAVRRLKAEVLLARRVSHPNVCRTYDLGAHVLENGAILNFLTMEFVDGERLAERLARGPLPLDTVQRAARQVLLGLEAAHGAGILHRDLKCDNVMLRATPDGDIAPVIMDFGLARAIGIDDSRVTSGVNGLLGTPCYMAPEQLEGAEQSKASDVYSFGVMWFEMLTQRLPFSPKAPFERLGKPPPRPSTFRRDVSPGIEKIVLRCLERSLEQRYASAQEVLRALDGLEPDTLDAAAASTRVVPPARKSRVPLTALVAAAMVGLAGVLWAGTRATPAGASLATHPVVEQTAPGKVPVVAREPAKAEPATAVHAMPFEPEAPPARPAPAKEIRPRRAKEPPAVAAATASPVVEPATSVPEPISAATTGPPPVQTATAPESSTKPSPETLGFANPFRRRER